MTGGSEVRAVKLCRLGVVDMVAASTRVRVLLPPGACCEPRWRALSRARP